MELTYVLLLKFGVGGDERRRRRCQGVGTEGHESVLKVSDGVDERLHPLEANLEGVGAEEKGLFTSDYGLIPRLGFPSNVTTTY